jgi:signal transduction histidine kinase
VERYGHDKESFPPIRVVVIEGKEDITIKISDEGGGIPRSAIPLIWTYMYTTLEGQTINQDFKAGDFKAPMAGFGYGLPLSRLVCDSRLGVFSSVAQRLILVVCTIFWRRSAIDLHGRIRDGCIYPFKSSFEQPGATAVTLEIFILARM